VINGEGKVELDKIYVFYFLLVYFKNTNQPIMKNLIILMLSIFLWACSSPVITNLESEKAALLIVAKAYQDAGTAMDVEKMVSFYTIDARLIPPGGEIVKGTDAIRKFMQEIIKLKNFQAKFETPEVEISTGGDMGYSLAAAVLSFEDAEGKLISEDDRDFHVWKKADGVWKLAIDIWNSAPSGK
jgi:uncharacterized protein (TIGR02246 family)